MGWWSSTILGGDRPLDVLGDLARVCGIHFDMSGTRDDTLSGYPFERASVERSLGAMVASVRGNKFREDRAIAGQVLGVIILWTGAEAPEEVLTLCADCARDDDWMREEGTGSDRGGHIAALLVALGEHRPGRRASLDSEGLFEKMAQKMAATR